MNYISKDKVTFEEIFCQKSLNLNTSGNSANIKGQSWASRTKLFHSLEQAVSLASVENLGNLAKA